jgi:hypothetical protein
VQGHGEDHRFEGREVILAEIMLRGSSPLGL